MRARTAYRRPNGWGFFVQGVALCATLRAVARARGMTNLAKRTGLTRMGLYKALSKDGNPSFDTVLKVLHALGLRLTATPA